MKILFAVHSLSGGGAEKQLSYLAESLVTSGIELNVVYRETGPLGDAAFVPGVRYTKLKTKGNYNVRVIPELFNIVSSFKPDLIQSWINQFDVLIGVIRIFKKFKWISREANAGSNHKGIKNKWLRELLLSRVDFVVANSPKGYEYWKHKRKSILVLNGFKKGSIDVDESLKLVEKNTKYLMFVGRLVKHKNVDLLIKSFALTQNSEYKLVICGVGNMENELKNLVTENNLEDRVLMLGYLPASIIQGLMSRAKGVCLLSDYEGMPNVVFEAMMLSTPVLLSMTESHSALFDESCVSYVDTENASQVTEALDNLMVKNSIAKKLENANKFVSSCSVEQMSNKYKELYSRLIEFV